MAAVLSGNNVEEEYLWSCSLDKDNKEFDWNPENPTEGPDSNNDDEKEDLKPGHRLLIKTAILMPQTEKDVVNVVQIECEGYNNKKVIVPVVAMKGQVDLQRYVDLLVPCPAKIKLLSGEGPIYLSGSHCVDYYGYRGEQGEDEESEEEEEEMEEDGDKNEDLRNKLNKKEEAKKIETKSEAEGEKPDGKKVDTEMEEPAEEQGSKKRKASEDPTPEKEKKMKTGSTEKKEKRKSK